MATECKQVTTLRSFLKMAASKAVVSTFRTGKTPKKCEKSPPTSAQEDFTRRLPSEILMKILSYLDAGALFSISHCNKLFFQLSRDNALWHQIYIVGLRKENKPAPDSVALALKTEPQLLAVGLWKQLYFNSILSSDSSKWKHLLKSKSRYTGLPSQTNQVLRKLHVTWELTVTDKSGYESTLELSWSQFSETSLTLCWCGGGSTPHYEQISTLQLHAVKRIDLNCPGVKTPGRKSLMEKLDMQPPSKTTHVIGQDRLVQLKLLQPGVIVGVWKDQCSVAFIMFTLHTHRLVERCLYGSSTCSSLYMKPAFDDIDPEYGLHGYQLHIVLLDAVSELMSGSFSQLFCRRAHISDGLIRLTVVSRTKVWQHMQLLGDVVLRWKCEALQGSVENCCIMSLTLLHNFGKPLKCVSSPVSMELEKMAVFFDYVGDTYLIQFQDSDIQVKMQLVRTKEEKKFVLVSLDVYVSVCFINKQFGRNY